MTTAGSGFEALPHDVLYEIASLLSSKVLLNLVLCSKYLKHVFSRPLYKRAATEWTHKLMRRSLRQQSTMFRSPVELEPGTTLHLAAASGHEDMVRRIVHLGGAPVDPRGPPGTWTPLRYAVWGGHYGIVSLLLEAGADPRGVLLEAGAGTRRGYKGDSAICIAAALCWERIFDLLLEYGAASTTTPEDRGVLHRAVYPKFIHGDAYPKAAEIRIRMAEKLLSRGFEINAIDRGGFAPIHRAITSGEVSAPLVRYLISQGADVNQLDANKRTALHWAAKNGNLEVARILLDNDAKERMEDDRGYNALDHLQDFDLLIREYWCRRDVYRQYIRQGGEPIDMWVHMEEESGPEHETLFEFAALLLLDLGVTRHPELEEGRPTTKEACILLKIWRRERGLRAYLKPVWT